MKYFSTFIILFTAGIGNCFAQDLPSIETDRPDQTESPAIVPKNYFQFENGFSYEKTDNHSNEYVIPSTLTKFGINDHLELRLITEFMIANDNEQKITGIAPVLIGFKTRLFEEKGIIPLTSFIAHLSLPKLASKNFKTDYYAPEFRFTMQHTLSDKLSLGYNLGAEWDGITPEPTFIYTITSGFKFSEKVNGYIELYGFIPQLQKADHRFDAGLNYLLNPNHQLDISGGFGLSETSPDYFVALGYSFRFKI
ncbi:transporter [Flavobacterium sp.]|uniref:transporter n=1 Tax=Flavobacterium sp. TaxID=239 RepID=UPI002CCD748E|nr:transporter [Flavobacterium sp.]HSD06629.1 transporter [Flavobacterium sp.]